MPQKTRVPPCAIAADTLCRHGTGRHKWRPYGQRRWQPDALARNAAATHSRPYKKRRGATCDARMTDAITRDAAKNADAAARNAADTLCRHGTGRHKWRPYGAAGNHRNRKRPEHRHAHQNDRRNRQPQPPRTPGTPPIRTKIPAFSLPRRPPFSIFVLRR